MPIPNRRDDLTAFGYSFQNEAHCRGCNAKIEWWSTPKGKKMPFDVRMSDGQEVLESHWATCPVADRFRSRL
jgi:hypothetical protein